MMKILILVFVQIILQNVVAQERQLSHSPVKIGFFTPQKIAEVSSRNQLSIPVKVTIIDQRLNNTEQTTTRKRASSCNFDSSCSNQYCCTDVLGRTEGQCYDASATKCCALDGNILPESIAAKMTGECCSYSAKSNTYTSCPPNAESAAYNKCGSNGTCVQSCNANTDCSAGSSCCKAPASTDPNAGHRCYSATEMCCFDGRICTAETCTDLPSGGQCCGINAADGQFSFCEANSYCNVVNGALACTSTQFGQDASSTTYVVPISFDSNQSSGKSSSIGLIVGIAVPVAVVVAAIIFAIVFLVVRRRKNNKQISKVVEPTVPPHYSESSIPSEESMKYHKLSINAMKPSYATMPTGAGTTVTPAYNHVVRPDGGTYAAMEATATAEDKNRGIHSAIDWSEIEMIEAIGHGSFGEAYRAKWHEAVVAVKKIHPDLLGNEEAILNFYGETEILKTLKPHPNTVLFFGVTKEPIAILMEFCENGSLRQYLDSSAAITINMKRNFLLGIARGMLHLHFYHIIHRDLAARNILLTSNFDVKVSDFGFSRELEGPDANRIKTPVGPVNWFPPEALKENSFSTKTDVWSFGVVIYEVITRKEPFADKSSAEVIVGVTQNGLTVDIPDDCPLAYSNLMRMCFQQNPADRPTFKEICNMLESEPTTVTA